MHFYDGIKVSDAWLADTGKLISQKITTCKPVSLNNDDLHYVTINVI